MSLTHRISVVVAHDDPVTRSGLSATLGRYSDLEVLELDDAADGWMSLARQPAKRLVDIVVADYDHGVHLAALAAQRADAAVRFKIVIVASADRECEIRNALEHGVRGYLLAGCSRDELALCVRTVSRGSRHLCPQVAQRLAESMSAEPLTPREEEVLRLVVGGLGNKAIARRLAIAVGTVKSHLKGVFDKLGVDSRTQAVAEAERRGLLPAMHPPADTDVRREGRPILGRPDYAGHPKRARASASSLPA